MSTLPKPEMIVTPGGDELVVLTRAEYETLLSGGDDLDEDAEDDAIYDARKADLEAGTIMPAEISSALLKGDGMLKAVRRWPRISQVALAASYEIGQGYLSDLETGRPTGAPQTIAKLSAALDAGRMAAKNLAERSLATVEYPSCLRASSIAHLKSEG